MSTDPLDLRGEIIDSRYRIERRIGHGGMGIVWQAQHLGTRQAFAIKTVHGSRSPDRKVLRRLLNSPPMRAGEVLWVTRQVSHALALAHERGIVHRDLKPSNIFLAEDDDGHVTVKVCDFGIAKFQGAAIAELAETGTLSTETGALFGTPRYMAPNSFERQGTRRPQRTNGRWR